MEQILPPLQISDYEHEVMVLGREAHKSALMNQDEPVSAEN